MLNSFQKAGRNLTDINDDDLSEEQLFPILKQSFENLLEHLKETASYYVTTPQSTGLAMMMMMMREAGYPLRHVLIWKKNQPTFSMNRLDYDYQHEPILYGWLKKHDFKGKGQHKTSVWEIDKPRESKEHPTMKPIELMANAIANSSEKNDLVVDIYLGSGSTLIACEQTDRICYGLELDPAYVDVIVNRWCKLTGKFDVIRNGEKFTWPNQDQEKA